ncbi:baseplate J/gp47 family protein [Bacillus atrophaeus]|uniref:baseplate J/gp47 family protein n=1 Tax=Bacillus atrophaeus TaxID=1452 RepID=UPI002E1AEBEB|nr:baseplate J/gp47 family protein [Bacillus atrophaeus]
MREANAIHRDIRKRFERTSGKTIQEGSVIDFYTVAASETMEDVYEEIENNKDPHIYSKLRGQNLDDTGFFVNLPRRPGEDDEQYLYRLMNWNISSEASNTTAINDALLNLEYASNADYIPLTNGGGTASVFIIPKNYEEETIENAINEVEERLRKVASPSLYVEYIVPEIRGVRIHAYMQSQDGDVNQIRANLEQSIKDYVNSIPPREYLRVGILNRMGINEPEVNYFNILQVFIDGTEIKDIDILQNIESKFILDEIIWS